MKRWTSQFLTRHPKVSIACGVMLIMNGAIALLESTGWLWYMWGGSSWLLDLQQPLWMALNIVPFLPEILFLPQRVLWLALSLVQGLSMMLSCVMLFFNLAILGLGVFLILRTIRYKGNRIVSNNTVVSDDDLDGF